MITCTFSLSGVKELYICYQTFNQQDIVYPIYPIVNISTNAFKIQQNKTLKTFIINGISYSYVDLTGQFQSFTETLVEDEKGRWFQVDLNISSVYDQNMFDLIKHKHAMAFIVDNNGRKWMCGYEQPLKLTNYTHNSGINADGQNKYDLIYTGKSYNYIRNYELI